MPVRIGVGTFTDSMTAVLQEVPQPDHITALDIEDRDNLDERRQKYLRILKERLGFVPNVIQAYSFDNGEARDLRRLL